MYHAYLIVRKNMADKKRTIGFTIVFLSPLLNWLRPGRKLKVHFSKRCVHYVATIYQNTAKNFILPTYLQRHPDNGRLFKIYCLAKLILERERTTSLKNFVDIENLPLPQLCHQRFSHFYSVSSMLSFHLSWQQTAIANVIMISCSSPQRT